MPICRRGGRLNQSWIQRNFNAFLDRLGLGKALCIGILLVFQKPLGYLVTSACIVCRVWVCSSASDF